MNIREEDIGNEDLIFDFGQRAPLSPTSQPLPSNKAMATFPFPSDHDFQHSLKVNGTKWLINYSYSWVSGLCTYTLKCNEDSGLGWSANADITVNVGKKGELDHYEHECKRRISPSTKPYSIEFLRKSGKVTATCCCKNAVSFTYESSVLIKFDIVVSELKGLRTCAPEFDLLNENTAHDKVLLVNDQKFFVRSQYLSAWSAYFHKLFNSDFAESKMDEIRIEEVDADQFHHMRRIIHPTSEEITMDSVGYLLSLDDRFEMPFLTKKCIDVVKTNSDDKYALSLTEWADKYQLIELQEAAYILMKKMDSLRDYIEENRQAFDALPSPVRESVLYVYHIRENKVQILS